MTKPLVSVVIATYRDHKYDDSMYLEEAIRSCRNQSYDNNYIEVIVVDGGSFPPIECNTADKFIRHRENLGVCAAINDGAKLANSEWIVPLNADDRIGHTFVQDLSYAALSSNMPVAITMSSSTLDEKIYYNNYIPYCAAIKKRLWNSLEGYRVVIPEKWRAGDLTDWDFWIRAVIQYRAMGFEGPVPTNHISSSNFIYRDRPDSASKWTSTEFEAMRDELWRQHGIKPANK